MFETSYTPLLGFKRPNSAKDDPCNYVWNYAGDRVTRPGLCKTLHNQENNMSFNKYRKLQDLCRLDRFQPAHLSTALAITVASHSRTSPTLQERLQQGTSYHNHHQPAADSPRHCRDQASLHRDELCPFDHIVPNSEMNKEGINPKSLLPVELR